MLNFVIVFGLVLVGIGILCGLRARQIPMKKGASVRLSAVAFWVGLIGAGVFYGFAIYAAKAGEAAWTVAVFLLFTLGGFSLIAAYFNCRIAYDQNGFLHRSFFGITRAYSYRALTGIREGQDTWLYVGRHRICVDSMSVGGSEFVITAQVRYLQMTDSEILPRKKPRWDPFNGHVASAGGLIFVYVLIGVMCLGITALICWSVCGAAYSPEDTVFKQVCLVSCQQEGDKLVMYDTDGRRYTLEVTRDFDAHRIAAACDGKQTLGVYVTEHTPSKGEPYDSVKAMTGRYGELVSFAETQRMYAARNRWALLFFVGMDLLWAAFVALSVYVGRDPDKFPRWFVRWFFKDEYIRY